MLYLVGLKDTCLQKVCDFTSKESVPNRNGRSNRGGHTGIWLHADTYSSSSTGIEYRFLLLLYVVVLRIAYCVLRVAYCVLHIAYCTLFI